MTYIAVRKSDKVWYVAARITGSHSYTIIATCSNENVTKKITEALNEDRNH